MKHLNNTPSHSNKINIWQNPIHFIAFGFGAGTLPIAPGTWGTLIAIPFYLLLANLPVFFYLLIVIMLCIFGVWICQITSNDLKVHDHSGIVWDEIVGYLITMTAIPKHWLWINLGFLIFRLFDIWKPWPIRWLDKNIKGGAGIMFDDILAGLYAWVVLQIISIVFASTALML